MANKQIDALAAFTTPATGSDIIHAKQGGTDKKVTIDQLRSEVGSVGNGYIAAGSINAITLAAAGNSVAVTEYSDLLEVWFIATGTNSAGVTWNVNSLGGRAAVINGVALTGNEITIGDLVKGVYDLANTRFEITSHAALKVFYGKAAESFSGNKTFTGAGNVYNGINQVNLLDKSTTEAINGDWNFSGTGNIYNGIAQANLLDKSAVETVTGAWNFNSSGNIYNGIAQANLLDKSATETVSGNWNFTGTGNIYNGIAQANLLDKSAVETVGGAWNFTNSGNVYNGINQANLLDKSAAETISGAWNFTNPSDLKVNGKQVVTSRGALASKTVVQSIPNGVSTKVSFNTESYDTDSIHNNATNNTRFTVPAGVTKVKLNAQLWLVYGVYDVVSLQIYKNNSATAYLGKPSLDAQFSSTPTNGVLSLTSPVLQVTAGDYFELVSYQANPSVASRNTFGSNELTWMSMEIIE